MFISLNELKAIIIDIDSFPVGFDREWLRVNRNVKLLFFSESDTARLRRIKKLDEQFVVYLGSPTSIFPKKAILVEMIDKLELASYEVAFLSASFRRLQIIQKCEIDTIRYLFGDKLDYDEVGFLCDFTVSSIDDLNQTISGENTGYISEVYSNISDDGSIKYPDYCSVIRTEKEFLGQKCTIISGGRYFNTNDVRHNYHQLSKRILLNKSKDSNQDRVFLEIYESLLIFIDTNHIPVDGITRIPPRPSERTDRFMNIVDRFCIAYPQFENLRTDLFAIKDFPTQKNLNAAERALNIQGAYRASDKFRGKHVVLIDDVISTGVTAFEAAKVMYEQGASQITILVLAINQFQNNHRGINHKPLNCYCGRNFQLRFNHANNVPFFGCTGFQERVCKNTIKYTLGIKRHNVENRLVADVDEFSSDEFDFF